MKYCEEYAALISAWLDGALDEKETARLHTHLFSCPGCRAYLEDLQAVRREFPELESVEVPEGFTQAVMDRVRSSAALPPLPKKKPWSRRISRYGAALACCLLLLILAGGHQVLLRGAVQDAAMDQPEAASSEMEAEAQEPEEAATLSEDTASQKAQTDARLTEPVPEVYSTAQSGGTEDASEDGNASAEKQTAEPILNAPEAASGSHPSAEAETPAPGVLAVNPVQPQVEKSGEETAAEAASGGSGAYFAEISLTREEAGTLLDSFEGQELEGQAAQVYELTAEQYADLLAGLEEKNGTLPEETPGTADAACARVIVTED